MGGWKKRRVWRGIQLKLLQISHKYLWWFAHYEWLTNYWPVRQHCWKKTVSDPCWALFNWICSVDWFRFFFSVSIYFTYMEMSVSAVASCCASLAWAHRLEKRRRDRWGLMEADGDWWRRRGEDVFKRQMADLGGQTEVTLKNKQRQWEGRPPPTSFPPSLTCPLTSQKVNYEMENTDEKSLKSLGTFKHEELRDKWALWGGRRSKAPD